MSCTVTQSVALPITAEECFELLCRSETLARVAAPIVSYDGVNDFPEYWRVDQEINLRPRVLLMSQGDHFVTFTRIDKVQKILCTEEKSDTIECWRHYMSVQPTRGGRCVYTDQIEIDAGEQTRKVKLFAELFYWHRQRRFRKLLENGNI